MNLNSSRLIPQAWSNAWSTNFFKSRFQLGLIIWIILLIAFPIFFDFIEARDGNKIDDYLLKILPVYDVSVATFLIIWSMFIFLMYRSITSPYLLLLFLWGFIFLSLSRFLSIYLFPLNPPDQLIELRDPITNIFYGKKQHFITKDLFYSGHTSTQFLMYLCFTKKHDKMLALGSTMIIGILVLVQHIHYSIDVIAAPFMTYLVYLISKKITTV